VYIVGLYRHCCLGRRQYWWWCTVHVSVSECKSPPASVHNPWSYLIDRMRGARSIITRSKFRYAIQAVRLLRFRLPSDVRLRFASSTAR